MSWRSVRQATAAWPAAFGDAAAAWQQPHSQGAKTLQRPQNAGIAGLGYIFFAGPVSLSLNVRVWV